MSTLTPALSLWSRPAWDSDRWVRDFFGPVTAKEWATDIKQGINPAVEVARDGDDAVIRVDLPGVDVAEDVHVEVDKGRLVIRGERRDERTEERAEDGGVRGFSEVRYGSFHRSFALPAHITGDAVSAGYDAGVLTVRVAGAHKGAEAQRIAIESK
ncbi:Hsp20/alpha crystallin family protein [Mycolicibacterium pyrenivorans]|uniref:Hsp20/alpha crystallin family protein n=1 Tax=Mycolicibacterium pyrenivorans TaxID=187102 RepID=UPI0021F30AC0|nr:Hsp20/alpha crystallin family protein [Mycolicibacterium pyrenivorans]MCV7153417.1 Hsp20/alpha crystallin family protein [Mycolicibacterium pyrenivorans]